MTKVVDMHFHVTVVGDHTYEGHLAPLQYEGTLAEGIKRRSRPRADYFELTRGTFVFKEGYGPTRVRDELTDEVRRHIGDKITELTAQYHELVPSEERYKIFSQIEHLGYAIAEYDQARAGAIDWAAMPHSVLLDAWDSWRWAHEVNNATLSRTFDIRASDTIQTYLARHEYWATYAFYVVATGRWSELPNAGATRRQRWREQKYQMLCDLAPETLVSIYHCHA